MVDRSLYVQRIIAAMLDKIGDQPVIRGDVMKSVNAVLSEHDGESETFPALTFPTRVIRFNRQKSAAKPRPPIPRRRHVDKLIGKRKHGRGTRRRIGFAQ